MSACADARAVTDADLPGIGYRAWKCNFSLARTPRAIVLKLNGDIRKALAAPDVIQRLSSLGSEPAGSSPEEFAAYLKQDFARWSAVVKAVGIRVE